MEGIVLAGGFGTRLRQIVPDLPKPMAPVAGRPFLDIVLGRLAAKGFSRVIISLGYMAEKIQTHFGDEFNGMSLKYVLETSPLGTGGAIRFAMEQARDDHTFVFNGDTYLDLEVEQVEALWQAHRSPIIVGREVLDTGRYGRLLALNGQIAGFAEKGSTGPGLINAGCYVLNRGQLDQFAPMVPFSMETDYLVDAVAVQRFDLFVTEGQFIDIGIPEDFFRAQTVLARC